jgi:hypothetical protein
MTYSRMGLIEEVERLNKRIEEIIKAAYLVEIRLAEQVANLEAELATKTKWLDQAYITIGKLADSDPEAIRIMNELQSAVLNEDS